jgi:hypothetical protein
MQNKVFEPLTTAGKLLLGSAGALMIAIQILAAVASVRSITVLSNAA